LTFYEIHSPFTIDHPANDTTEKRFIITDIKRRADGTYTCMDDASGRKIFTRVQSIAGKIWIL
jgi:hypothetical protein